MPASLPQVSFDLFEARRRRGMADYAPGTALPPYRGKVESMRRRSPPPEENLTLSTSGPTSGVSWSGCL